MENFILANCTDTGKARNVNEDSMATFDSPNGRVVTVCDGMGGQNAGDVASQLAVTVIQDILSDNTFATPEEAITRSIIAANQAILRRAGQDVNLSGMGATCVMIIIKDGKVYYGSVGDSRIYYISGGMIRQITKDQSYVQTLVDAGEITQEAAEHHQDKNQITNALGLEGMMPPVIGQMPITPEPGSIFLLCSDGLSGMINNSTILNTVMNRNLSLNDRAVQLVNLANAAGGVDNITVQLVEFPESGYSQMVGSNRSYNHSFSKVTSSKRQKNRVPIYALSLCVLALIVGGGIYWYLSKEDPTPVVPKSSTTVKEKPVENKSEKKTIIVKEKTVVEDEQNEKGLAEREISAVEKGKSNSKAKSKDRDNTKQGLAKEISNKEGQDADKSQVEIIKRDLSREKAEP